MEEDYVGAHGELVWKGEVKISGWTCPVTVWLWGPQPVMGWALCREQERRWLYLMTAVISDLAFSFNALQNWSAQGQCTELKVGKMVSILILQSHELVLQQWGSPPPVKIPWVFLLGEVRSALNNSCTCAHPWSARNTILLACHPSCGHFTFHGCSYHEWSILQRPLRLSLEWRLNKDWLVPSMVPRKAYRSCRTMWWVKRAAEQHWQCGKCLKEF